MFNGNSAPSLADIAAVTRTNNGDGIGNGGNAWWVLIILFALFGGWGRGYGGGYGDGGSHSFVYAGQTQPCATAADVQAGFNQQTLISKIDGQTYGIADLGYAINSQLSAAELSRANQQAALMAQLNANNVSNMQNTNLLQAALTDCCCQNREAIAQVRYDMATQTCATQNMMQNLARDIQDTVRQQTIDAKDAKIVELTQQIQALNLAASQQAQNAYLIAQLKNNSTCSC